jgi:hypothetical protein
MRILVVGPGRSATSWVTATLGSTPGASFLLEPDHTGEVPFAARALTGMGTFPVVAPDAPGPPRLRRLWDVAFGAPVRYLRGQQRLALWLYSKSSDDERARMIRLDDPRPTLRLRLSGALAVPRHLPAPTPHRVVKSIRSHLMLEWIHANWTPSVVVCRRHPLDVVASRHHLFRPRLGGPAPSLRREAERRYGVEIPTTDDPVATFAWGVGVEMSVLDDALRANPRFLAVDHEDLCRDPTGHFRELVTRLGLEWTAAIAGELEVSNRPGAGYERTRVRADLPGAWRRRLSADDARTAAAAIARFPIAARYDLEVSKSA